MPARRHHYVPRMLLRQFSALPDLENPPIWKLPAGRGTPRRSSVDNETVIRDYYKTSVPLDGLPFADIEAFLAHLEGLAATAIRQLDFGDLDETGRLHLTLFLLVMHRRTPLGRTHT